MSVVSWKPVPGYEGRYEVSSEGEVRSLLRRERRILKQNLGRAGYPIVRLDGVTRRVAVLVAHAFLGLPGEGLILRHLNDVRTDSRLSNLAYGTHADNARDRVRNGRDAHARRTHCAYGHAFTPDNVAHYRQSGRTCKACHRRRAAERRARLKVVGR